MKDKKYTYDNWLNGEFNYSSSLLAEGKLSVDDFNLMLDKSYSLVSEQGEAEFNRLKLNFERTISEAETKKRESFSKEDFIKLEDDHYNLLLNKKVPEGNEYLEFNQAKHNKFTQYHVELIRSVQKYHSWLTEGKINLVIPNPSNEQFNPNTGSDFSAASLAIAWRCYRNYLKELQKESHPVVVKKNTTKKTNESHNSLTSIQIALICCYKKIQIPNTVDEKIKKQFDYKGNWGKLNQDYNYQYKNKAKEMKDPTQKKFINQIDRITSILTYLNEAEAKCAKDDIKLLETLSKNY